MHDETRSKIDQLKRWLAENQTMLKTAGVATIVATYGGDEGSFDGAEAVDDEGGDTDYTVPAEIQALLQTLADVLATPGYQDNDGGGGEIQLVVDTGAITHESYYYSVERHPDECQEF